MNKEEEGEALAKAFLAIRDLADALPETLGPALKLYGSIFLLMDFFRKDEEE